jgi:hypothetical protein
MLPADVLAVLAGTPVAGQWEPVFPLLTTDAGGGPQICLLSRAEIDAEPGIVRCAVRSRRTSANLRRSGAAVLQVVEGTTSWSVRTRVGRTVTDDGGLAAELLVTDVEQDSLGIPLRPMGFLADAAIARLERWDDNARLFARLARSARAAAGEETAL